MSPPDVLNDVALKPKLLRSLLREYVPDEKHPFGNPSELSYVVSTIKTHKLLSESAQQAIDQNLFDSWKSAVDSWLHRLLTLVSSSSPDKCWAGVCLLGLTCQECSSERFLSSYDDWLNKLLSQIQHPVASHFVKAASCAAISDLFTRLSGFENAKKDATSHATRVIPPALKLINEDSSYVVLEEAVSLVCNLINFFTFSVQKYYDNVEAAITSKLLSGKSSASVLKKLSYGLSLLPKTKGDADSWSLMMDKILLCINSQLTDALQGLEGESRSAETMRALFPSGKESPAPLGGLALAEQISDLSARRPERLLGSRISALMQCCSDMLTNSYPVMVRVPIHGLISLIERVLMVDGTLLLSSYAFITTMKHEFICSEIPLLQLHSLEILAAAVKGLSSQLLPHCAHIVQLLNEYLRRCQFPDLRRNTYSIVKELLLSMGIGLAMHVSQDIVSNVLTDFLGDEKDVKSPGTLTKVHSESRKKKRKHSSTEKSIQEHPAYDGLEGVPHNSTPIYLKIAALKVLEALLTVGGCVRSERWRGDVDRLLVNVATNACKGGGFSAEKRLLVPGNPTSAWKDFQLSALRALLASLLSPGHVRPPHLGLSLDLFRRGMQGKGTMLAEYCVHALLALEVLIHPRGLPLLDVGSRPDGYNYQSHGPRDRQLPTNMAGMTGQSLNDPESEDDELNQKWFGNDDEIQVQDTEMQDMAEKPSATARYPSEDGEKSAFTIHVPEKEEMTVTAVILNKAAMSGSNDYIPVSSVGSTREERAGGTAVVTGVDGRTGAQSETGIFQNVDSERKSPDVTMMKSNTVMKNHVAAEGNGMEIKDDSVNTIVERISATLEHTEKGEGSGLQSDKDELSTESIPDIVDGDPDSD